ncbi:hypothetical protein E4T50_12571 [Aureobasidium sp. EXF-12298]|nr:hypothetical protein E4T50_12571 [Aureobasidium sp. EXF-12298]KAI4754671.1 hypothetical protein E4T51_12238 [Aureobasidium sp. EXF-12344]KAI4771805.1 hypothetical protein E4T52_13198 [Aureobasidium sp. EXF-3400]
MAFQMTAPLLRLLIAIPIFLFGFKTCDIVNRPLPLINDLSTILSNQTLTLELPGHSDTVIATAYIPTSLYDHGRASIFWCGLLALASAGAYSIGKIQHHIYSQLLALNEGAKKVPKGQVLKYYIQGVRNLNLTGWVNATGARDTFMAWMFSLLALIGVLYPTIIAGIQNLASDSVANQLDYFLTSGRESNNTVFGSSSAHGTYTLESWTCQIAPLVSSSANITTSARPQWFTFTFGAEGRPAWMTVPLEETDKDADSDDDDEDPMAAYGNNAREQWQLD